MIRNYLDHENISVNIIGGGRDRDYGYLGFSHWSEDDVRIMSSFDNVKMFKPNDQQELVNAFTYSLTKQSATYINLKR
jgi:transketolase C-terminal domain/subunit